MVEHQNFEIGHVTLTTPIWGYFVMLRLTFACVQNLKTRFTCSGDTIGDPKLYKGSRD